MSTASMFGRLSVLALGLSLTLACDPTTPTGPGTDPTPEPEPVIETCEDASDALADELADIQTCTTADECGQVLTGTSCGCTRDLVARLDADTERFYDIMERQQELLCGGLISTCDCPPADGFDCVSGACSWAYSSRN